MMKRCNRIQKLLYKIDHVLCTFNTWSKLWFQDNYHETRHIFVQNEMYIFCRLYNEL